MEIEITASFEKRSDWFPRECRDIWRGNRGQKLATEPTCVSILDDPDSNRQPSSTKLEFDFTKRSHNEAERLRSVVLKIIWLLCFDLEVKEHYQNLKFSEWRGALPRNQYFGRHPVGKPKKFGAA